MSRYISLANNSDSDGADNDPPPIRTLELKESSRYDFLNSLRTKMPYTHDSWCDMQVTQALGSLQVRRKGLGNKIFGMVPKLIAWVWAFLVAVSILPCLRSYKYYSCLVRVFVFRPVEVCLRFLTT